ncbi:KamA family radical SAM protein [Streptomyces mirabilis]|uniref:KamA family radical SAM protein n=1 Tax=Streptomyces mirabilis TaxID=68239 RepID=UPI003646BECD
MTVVQGLSDLAAPVFSAITSNRLAELVGRAGFTGDQVTAVRAVAEVLPFRTNSYVVDELIDWSAVPDDPIYRLVFPQEDMLPPADVARIADLLNKGAAPREVTAAANEVRRRLNPHPAGQLELNIPSHAGAQMPGVQHKYRETVLFFPKQGQTCHSYCTYCFRWAQFIGDADLKMASGDIEQLKRYLADHPEVSNVLFTGGDPMIMRAGVLRRYVEPLLELDQLDSIRIGTKALSYWPYKFTTDPDADDMLRLFEEVSRSGKDLSVMAHFSHPRELETPAVEQAVRRLRSAGASIRTQAPLMRYINDDSAVWSTMWSKQVSMGMVPYYMFIERDTGPQEYFKVPLADAYEIFRRAYRDVSGLCRTVRGPSMSTTSGKVCVDGVVEVAGEKVFALHYIQCRDADAVGRPFFAKFDPAASWFSELVPAFEGDFPVGIA